MPMFSPVRIIDGIWCTFCSRIRFRTVADPRLLVAGECVDDAFDLMIEAHPRDLSGFTVRRILPSPRPRFVWGRSRDKPAIGDVTTRSRTLGSRYLRPPLPPARAASADDGRVDPKRGLGQCAESEATDDALARSAARP
jgi:hypothetical protein